MSIKEQIKDNLLAENYQKLDNLYEELELHFSFTPEQMNELITILNKTKENLFHLLQQSNLK
jgi:hypothetical protein